MGRERKNITLFDSPKTQQRHEKEGGADGGTRTRTGTILSRLPLPLGYIGIA